MGTAAKAFPLSKGGSAGRARGVVCLIDGAQLCSVARGEAYTARDYMFAERGTEMYLDDMLENATS